MVIFVPILYAGEKMMVFSVLNNFFILKSDFNET